jgi:ribonuclease E
VPAADGDQGASAPPRPRIGDTRPAPESASAAGGGDAGDGGSGDRPARRRRGGRGRGGRGRGDRPATQAGAKATADGAPPTEARSGGASQGQGQGQNRGRGGRGGKPDPVQPVVAGAYEPLDLDEDDLARRRGRERKGRPVGRYLMCVSVGPKATQIAVLEGRNLIEHYVARPADDISQIHGNIYLGRVQNVLPGMEAAFIDIGTPKNAVLYRSDVQFDPDELEGQRQGAPRIEDILKPRQTVLCQVTKNPIAHKGARLTQEVSIPGRFVVLIPNSSTYGISKRLPDDERKRLRGILDKVRPKGHGLIVRTAAEGVTAEEIERDVLTLSAQWEEISALSTKAKSPALLYREPDMAVRVIREELNQDYRGIIIDDRALYEEVRSYVAAISPALVERVQFYDPATEPLSIFERHHVHEQLHRALDRKVWLPSGGSLIIEHTEALTVIDVNTGKNVGSSNLEETVFRNNLEAAEEVAKQLRLRDIGGIIVIDFIDMEIEKNRTAVIKAFREALSRDKTRTQVFDISELGLVEMTRKRIGEGLLESMTTQCPRCDGRGLLVDEELLR